MNKNNLLKLTMENSVSCLAIIGLAKNAGKTVALNTLIREAVEADVKLTVASYGRDGEDIDAITQKEKPLIFIPPNTYFVTAEKLFEKSSLQGAIVIDTGIDTLLGKVKIYKSGTIGDSVELAGVNRGSRMMKIKELLPEDTELFLIDGALNRRSSAIPSLTHGIVLATGAVVGNTVELIVQRTMDEVKRFTLTPCPDEQILRAAGRILGSGQSGLIRNGEIIALTDNSFGKTIVPAHCRVESGDFLVYSGALTDSAAEEIIYEYRALDCTLIVRDGTRIFISRRNMNLLKKNRIRLCVYEPIKLIALTVNPYSPYDFRVDSELLRDSMRESLCRAGIEIPVFDVLAKDYL
ncbi:MAG: hypothetical protein L3J12_02150 [Spirochaetales bacterium]|nr:hypothetical protein [Spirochaetales bacterium]